MSRNNQQDSSQRNCPHCLQNNEAGSVFCMQCGIKLRLSSPSDPPLTASKSSRPTFFSVLAISIGTILVFGLIGLVIGAVVGIRYFAGEDTQGDNSGLYFLFAVLGGLMIMVSGGVIGGGIGAMVGIVISLIKFPNKTNGDYFRVIGAPLLVILVPTLLMFFQADGVSLVTDAYNQNREDAKLDKELEAAVEIAKTYAQSECEYIKTILVEEQYPASQDRLVSLVSREYQLFRPIEITHSWDSSGDAPPALVAPPAVQEPSLGRWGVLMRYTATEARGPFYDVTETQSMWDSILPNITHDTYQGPSPSQRAEDRANPQNAMDATLLRGYHHKILSLAGIWRSAERLGYDSVNDEIARQSRCLFCLRPNLDFVFMVQENGLVISKAGLCYQNKENFSDIILDTLLDHSVALPK